MEDQEDYGMNVECFFATITPIAEQKDAESPHHIRNAGTALVINPERSENGAGWRATFAGGVSWGDTIEDAIQAAFDHFTRAPSRHSRLNPPFYTRDRETKNWAEAHRGDYNSPAQKTER